MALDGIGGDILKGIAKSAIDPLGLFSGKKPVLDLFAGDSVGKGGGSGLFPTGRGGRGDLTDMLANMPQDEKNKQMFNVGNAADGLLSGGKSGGGGGGMESAMGAIKEIMGIVKQLLPLIMAFF